MTPFFPGKKSQLISHRLLRRRIKEMAVQIRGEMAAEFAAPQEPIMVVMLKGGFLFAADLLRAIRSPMPVVFIAGRESSPDLLVSVEDQQLLVNRHLLVVDLLLDEGSGMRRLLSWLQGLSPASIRLAILLHRSVGQIDPEPVDFLGFEVPNVRLVGYGLDESQRFRGMSGIHSWTSSSAPHSPPG